MKVIWKLVSTAALDKYGVNVLCFKCLKFTCVAKIDLLSGCKIGR